MDSNAALITLGQARHHAEVIAALRAQRTEFTDALTQLADHFGAHSGRDDHLDYLRRTYEVETSRDQAMDLDLGVDL